MTRELDLDDIQGNVIRAYGRFGYPKARYFFLTMSNAWVGRHFVERVIPHVTTARRWPEGPDGSRRGPDVTLNIGFTFMGLFVLDLPTRTLRTMPAEFIDGMRKRAFILGDQPASVTDRAREPIRDDDPLPDWMARWDPIWRENRARVGSTDVHVWISMNARVEPGTETPVSGTAGVDVLEERTAWLRDLCAEISRDYAAAHDGDTRGVVRILDTNGQAGDQEFQEASAIFEDVETPEGMIRLPTPYEHFGLTDGIGDPVFAGQFAPEEEAQKLVGRGKWMDPDTGWEPLATGEFLLGHPDESQELPPAARPPEFSANGTFMAYRKLHENVDAFRDFFRARAKTYAAVSGMSEPQAEVVLRAKVVGRWPDGVPLSTAPTWDDWMRARDQHGLTDAPDLESWKRRVAYLRAPEANDFKYGNDIDGRDCPNGSHLRRVNTRDYLDPENHTAPDADPDANRNARTSLNKRRRILRRGLPYGPSSLGEGSDDSEQGIAMMVICASLFRQFEFVQQQWIQYGLDFNAGNNTCPLVGDHDTHSRFTIPADPVRGETPFILDGMPTFVEPRGGEYFFLPSMTALRMIAAGIVDPT